jgi:hypothetical protein
MLSSSSAVGIHNLTRVEAQLAWWFNRMPSAHSAVCDRVHGQHACDSIACLLLIQQCGTEFVVSLRGGSIACIWCTPFSDGCQRKLCDNTEGPALSASNGSPPRERSTTAPPVPSDGPVAAITLDPALQMNAAIKAKSQSWLEKTDWEAPRCLRCGCKFGRGKATKNVCQCCGMAVCGSCSDARLTNHPGLRARCSVFNGVLQLPCTIGIHAVAGLKTGNACGL